MLRKLVQNGSKTEDFRYVYLNERILQICKSEDIHTYVARQQESYLEHLARQSNKCLTKRLLFNVNKRTKVGRPAETCLLYTSPSPRDKRQSRMPSSA